MEKVFVERYSNGIISGVFKRLQNRGVPLDELDSDALEVKEFFNKRNDRRADSILIKQRIESLARIQAIEELKAEKKLSANYSI